MRLPIPLLYGNALLVLVLGLSGCSNSPTDQASGEHTEILWDTWGVPHIFATDNSSLFYALGWHFTPEVPPTFRRFSQS